MGKPSQKQLRLCLINCENLFLFLDMWQGQDFSNLNEKEWQRLNSSNTANKPLLKTRWLADTLLEIDADIVLLNEVGGLESLEHFNRHFLKDVYQPYLKEGNSDRGIDVGYLVRRGLEGKFVHLSHKQRPLNFLYPHEQDTNTYFAGLEPTKQIRSHLFSRDASELRWFLPGTHSPALIFLLVHLKSRLDPDNIDPGGTLRREAELKALIEIYNEIRKEVPQTPVIVAGDFNGFASRMMTSPEFADLHSKSDLVEVFDHLSRSLEECATQINFYRSMGRQFTKIDHVFVSPELTSKIDSAGTYVHRFRSDLRVMLPYAQTLEQRMALPSDHYPVVVTISDPF
ncbi:MAG: endonuclease/exonuclease/phosphatase family protein [Bdellovibrionales bacterium]